MGNRERVIALEGGMKCKTRELSTLGKKLETKCSGQAKEIRKRDLQAQVSPAFLCFLCLLFVVSSFILYFSKKHEKYRKKLETTNDNEKTQRKAAEMEAAVASELVLFVHE